MLLGYGVGEMAIGDPLVKDWIDHNAGWLHVAAPALGAIGVVLVGRWLAAAPAVSLRVSTHHAA